MKKLLLAPWQEVTGKVTKAEVVSGLVVLNLSFTAANAKIEVPLEDFKPETKDLKEYIGKKISVLRTDSGFILNTYDEGVNPSSHRIFFEMD